MSRHPRTRRPASSSLRTAAPAIPSVPRGASWGLPVAVVFRALMTLPQRDRRGAGPR